MKNWRIILLSLALALALGVAAVYVYVYVTNPDPTRTIREANARAQVTGGHAMLPAPALTTVPPPPPPAVASDQNGQLTEVLPQRLIAPTPRSLKPPNTLPITPPPDAGKSGIVAQSPLLDQGDVNGATPVPNALLNQTPPGGAGSPTGGQLVTRVQVPAERFFFDNRAPSALAADKMPIKSENETGYNLKTFAPQGEDIEMVMGDNVTSNDFETGVTAFVWFPFYSGGHVILERATKLIGTAAKGKSRKRILVTFDHVILKNRRSFPIKAIALDTDGTVGVPGYQVGNVLLQNLGPLFLAAVAGMTQDLQQNTTTPNLLSSTGYSVSPLPTLENGGLQSAQNVIQKINDLVSQDLEDEKPYVVVPAGTRFRARLVAPLDASVADYGK